MTFTATPTTGLLEPIPRLPPDEVIFGSSAAMCKIRQKLEKAAGANIAVLLRGQSGTGKEVLAKLIHSQSPLRNGPFVKVSCPAIPGTLIESELFGYEKGAFTGAAGTKEGRIELAHRGTLFLDEIGTLTPAVQSKLLRVLEERALTRLGGKKPIRVDFRLISATNVDLEEMVRQDRFREDLYYRIQVVPIFVPALRERVEDIPILAEYFVSVYCAANSLPPKRIADDAMQALKRYPWPGNVRELENAIQRLVIMTDDDTVSLKDLPAEIVQGAGRGSRNHFRLTANGISLDKEIEAFERRWVETALEQTKHVK